MSASWPRIWDSPGGGAHVTNLRRTRIGSFGGVEMQPLDAIGPASVLTPAQAMRDLDAVTVEPAIAAVIRTGLALDRMPLGAPGDGPWAMLDESGSLLAVYEATGTDRIRPAVVLGGGSTGAGRERVPSGAMPGPGTAVTIGAYDGVHLGHRALLRDLSERAAAEGLSTVVVTFDRHPASVVRPDSAPKQLTSLEQKLELLAECGIGRTLVVPFDEARADETAEEFVQEVLVDQLGARLVVVGEDFHFGHGRKGNVELLRRLGAEHGFEVVGVGLTDDGSEPVSSTRIRGLIAEGDVAGAARLLGRPHEVRGPVVRGDGRGGPELGFPTANMAVDDDIALPADGDLRRLLHPGRRLGPPERHLGRPATHLLRARNCSGAGGGLPAALQRRPLRRGGPGVLPPTSAPRAALRVGGGADRPDAGRRRPRPSAGLADLP